MTKYTPAPWYASPTSYGWDVWGNLCNDPPTWIGPVKRVISPHSKIHSGKDICADEEETDANARLIAAAPDLLEALRGLLEQTAQYGHHEENEAARAAIAKATK